MVKIVHKGLGMFAALLIANALMKVFGLPLVDLLPSGDWGLEWLQSAIHWLGTVDAVFWYLASGIGITAYLVIRGGWLSSTTAAVVGISLALGIVSGVVYRLTHRDIPVAGVGVDPSFWLMMAGLIAPAVLWLGRLAVEEAAWRVGLRREQQARERATPQPPQTPHSATP